MTKIKAMLIFSENFRTLRKLNDSELGFCIRYAMDYFDEIERNNEEIEDRFIENCIELLIKGIDTNKEHYSQVCEKRAAARKSGWEKLEKDEEKDIETQKIEIKKEQDLELDIESPQKKKREKKEEETFEVFNEAWELYPRKEGKNQVKKEAKKELEKDGIETIKQAINSYKKEIVGREKNFILQGSTFFNGRYKDYIIKEQPKKERENKDWSDSDLEELRKLGYDV